jgi:organic hydroperoxide reductase OsmC/OhrA
LPDGSTRGREHRYSAQLTWTGNKGAGTSEYRAYGRSYTVDVDGKPTLPGSADAMFLGDPTRHNPEDLFLAAIAGCHMLAYLALCASQGVCVLAYTDEAEASLALDAEGGRFTEVTLRPRVTIAAGDDATLAEALHHTAHQRCFIANSCSVPIRCDAIVSFADADSTQPSGAAP